MAVGRLFAGESNLSAEANVCGGNVASSLLWSVAFGNVVNAAAVAAAAAATYAALLKSTTKSCCGCC